jgi:ABC-type arginine transport system ATPase subunit
VWPLVVVGGALQVVAIAVALLMNKAGLGHDNNRQWAELKAQARAARQA